MSLEFSECMYNEMEGFVGKRQISGRTTDVVDSDRVSPQRAMKSLVPLQHLMFNVWVEHLAQWKQPRPHPTPLLVGHPVMTLRALQVGR